MKRILAFLACMAVARGASAANRVEVFFDVPQGMGAYSGVQAVTFGLPFEKGALKTTDGLRLADEVGKALPGQFEVTATWAKDSKEVRWLLVDGLADIRQGKAQKVFLEYGPDVPVLREKLSVPDVKSPDLAAEQFMLTDGAGKRYTPKKVETTVERNGPARQVVRQTGEYTAEDGQCIAEFSTRYRLYPGQPFMRVYHTMIWLTDDQTKIGELRFEPAKQAAGDRAQAGLDGKPVALGKGATLFQKDWDKVGGSAEGRQLDGWVASGAGQDAVFAALRWPWQQYPIAFDMTEAGRASIRLIGPEQPMSLKAEDVAVPAVMHNVASWNLRIFKGGLPMEDVIYNGPPALPHLTPRGVSKTWEILVWKGASELAPETRNILAQHPVLAYADPVFATRAGLPSPSSAYDPKSFPEVEAALQRAFGWFTREAAEEGDFGVWNYGDLQWAWSANGGYAIYRYWMNNGKGWAVLPWTLWLRSGDRRYWENGEAKSRHTMDVDTCHIRGWERDPNDFRLRGGQYHYSAIHWGYGPEVVTYYADSEYMPYCYYMTGYERAKDVMLEHAEQMARFPYREAYAAHFRKDFTHNASRHLYVMVKNLCVLYEATWDDRLKEFADLYLTLMAESQMPDGNFPGVKNNHYTDEPLNIALRVFGPERVAPMLKRWHDLLGDPIRPSSDGNVCGPMSLWSAVTMYNLTKDPHHLEVAAKLMNAQAAAIDDSGTAWRGLGPFLGHIAGPTLRDWTVVMSALARLPEGQRPTGCMQIAGFHSRLPGAAKGAPERDVALVLCEKGDPFELQISFAQHMEKHHIRVLGPDGTTVLDEDFTLVTMTNENMFAAQAVRRKIDPKGVKGVYTVELTAAGRYPVPATVKSSTGKVVYLMPPGSRVFMGSEQQGAGQFWFKPVPGAQVSYSFLNMRYIRGRTVARDPAGKVVGASLITGQTPVKLPANPPYFAFAMPQGTPCAFTTPAEVNGLYSIVTALTNNAGYSANIGGMQPFISATQEEWFDPAQYPCMDLKVIIGGGK